MLRLFIFLFSLFSVLGATLQKIDNVEVYVDLTLGELKQKVDEVMKIPEAERNFNNTILAWEEIGTLFFSKVALLKCMENCESGFQKMCSSFNELITKKEVQQILLNFVEKTSSLTLSEKYYLRPFKRQGDDLPFTESFGKAKKQFDGKLTIVNWNVCFLPGQMPFLFGGIAPWEKRIDAAILLLKKVDADVICLQEVFERKAALRLYDALKDRYALFYYNISPRNLGLDPQNIGLCSGLFVASKYPVENPRFEKFEKVVQPYIDRGFFSFDIKGIKVVTTHLEATLEGIEEPAKARHCQLQQIIKQKPSIICGDLNIAWGKNEPAEILLKEVYADPYNENRVVCTFENCTHCDYGENQAQILDYFVISREVKCAVNTQVLPVCMPHRPLEALSDHHLQISTIELK